MSVTGLALFLSKLEKAGFATYGHMTALFTLYSSDQPLTTGQIFEESRAGHRTQLLNDMVAKKWLGRTPRFRSKAQNSGPSRYTLGRVGSLAIRDLLKEECRSINESDHLVIWLSLARDEGLRLYTDLRAVVAIETAPGSTMGELFGSKSGARRAILDRLVNDGFIEAQYSGRRIEYWPGDAWWRLRHWLNVPFPRHNS